MGQMWDKLKRRQGENPVVLIILVISTYSLEGLCSTIELHPQVERGQTLFYGTDCGN